MALALRPLAADYQQEPAGELATPDLLLDFGELCAELGTALDREDLVDGYLLASALNQVLEDHLHRDVFALRDVAARLSDLGTPGRAGAAAVRAARRTCLRLRRLRPGWRRMVAAQSVLAGLLNRLADGMMGAHPGWPELRAGWLAWTLRSTADRGLREAVMRLPSCFRDLDQRPVDLDRLAAEVAACTPAGRVLAVVGLRTSGSYLAPLLAAGLRRRGRAVLVCTVRPGADLLPAEARYLTAAASEGAVAVLVDDPPDSGRALAKGAALLARLGFDGEHRVVAIALLDDGSPPRLAGQRLIALPFQRWQIHAALDEESVHRALARLLPGREIAVRGTLFRVDAVREVRRSPASPAVPAGRRPRRHLEGIFEVSLVSGARVVEACVHARGCGLGFLGRHALAVAERLADWVPPHYGIDDGILYREWAEGGPGILPLDQRSGRALGEAITAYVGARSLSLAVPADKSLRLSGRNPVWQRAADVMSGRYHRLRPLVRTPMHTLARRILDVPRPSITDGDMVPGNWRWAVREGAPDRLVKVRADEVAFSNEDLACYDADFDLAAAAVSIELESPGAGRLVGSQLSNSAASAARWTLYKLERLQTEWRDTVIARAQRPASDHEPLESRLLCIDEARERTVGEFIGRALALRAEPPQDRFCAIDVDGVLESDGGGYSCSTPAGVEALRSLTRHGFTPILASGRSVADLEWRCDAFGLAGAVAEYGCRLWLARDGRAVDLVDPALGPAVTELKTRLRAAGLRLDPAYRWAVRAFAWGPDGVRRAPDAELVRNALAGLEDTFRVVAGWSQIDLVPGGADKDAGLRALMSLLAPAGSEPRLELAVGDSLSDLPMLRLAAKAAVPAGARADLRGAPGVRLMRHAGQRGLAEAAALVTGHRPRGCELCSARPPDRDNRLLLEVLGARDVAPGLRLMRAWSLMWEALR